MQEESNSQVSDPYRRIGMMQVSKMLDPERGLSLPWKTPVLPRPKKALLALEILVLIDSLAERFPCHCIPRHLAEFFVTYTWSPMKT